MRSIQHLNFAAEKTPLSGHLTNGHLLLSGTIFGHTKLISWSLSTACAAQVAELCEHSIQHETTVFTVRTQWFWLLRECLMSTVELLWCQSKVSWVKRCPYFGGFRHISTSDIVFKIDILPICDLSVSFASQTLFVFVVRPMKYQIQVLEAIGTMEQKRSALWDKVNSL